MTIALRPNSPTAPAVSSRPSSVRATSATSAPAAAMATAMARPIPREAPVMKACLPVRSNTLGLGLGLGLIGALPLGGQRVGRRVDPADDLIEHDTDVGLPHPQVLGLGHA